MNKTLLLKTLRGLRANLAQTLALIFVVALGISSFIALISAYRDLGSSYQRTYETLRFADVTFSFDAAPETILSEVRALEQVQAASGRLVLDTGFELADGEQIRSRLIGLPAGQQPAVNQLLMEQGSYLPDEGGATVVVEAHFADFYGLEPGDQVTPIVMGETIPLEIAGIATSPEYLIVSPSQQDIFPSARTFAVLFLPLSYLQELTGAPDSLNEIAVRVKPGADRAQAISKIQQLLKPYGLEATTPREDNPSNAALQLDLAGYGEIAVLMPGLILLVATISVYVMLGRLVRAQQPEIGIMKAIGYSSRAVMVHYLLFALVIGSVGALLGILAGIPLASWITGTYASELGIPLVETRFYPDLVLGSVLLSLALAVLAGIGPARQSAGLPPAEAMNLDPSAGMVQGRISLVERLVRLPLWLRLPLRNVLRMRRRSFTTGLGIVFAFILVLMVWGMLDSMNNFISYTFEEVERWDIAATFAQPQTAATLERVRQLPGVEAATPLIQLPATVRANGEEQDILLTALEPEQELHALQLEDDLLASDALQAGEIVLTGSLAEQLDLQRGDELTLSSPFGEGTYLLGGSSQELMSAAAYLSLEEAQDMLPLPAPVFNGLYLQVDPSRADAIKAEIYRLPGAASVQLKSDMRQDLESLMGLFYAFMGVMLLFAVAMAFALIFNAMTVNVLERQRELATMRAIGTGSGRIAAQITAENVILWLLALLPGLLLGRWVAMQMGEAFSAELFTFDVVISPLSYLLTSLGVLLTMIVAALPAIRRVNRLDLAEATKVLT